MTGQWTVIKQPAATSISTKHMSVRNGMVAAPELRLNKDGRGRSNTDPGCIAWHGITSAESMQVNEKVGSWVCSPMAPLVNCKRVVIRKITGETVVRQPELHCR